MEQELQAAVSILMWVLGLKSGPLQEPSALLTAELPLQPFKKFIYFRFIFIILNYICACGFVYMNSRVSRGQRYWIPLELELEASVSQLKSVLGPELRSVRTV